MQLPTPDNLQYLNAVRQLDEVVYGLIRGRRKELEVLGARTAPEGEEASAGFKPRGASHQQGVVSLGPPLPQERWHYMLTAHFARADLLDRLILSRDEAGQGMGDRQLRDELMTLLASLQPVLGGSWHPSDVSQ